MRDKFYPGDIVRLTAKPSRPLPEFMEFVGWDAGASGFRWATLKCIDQHYTLFAVNGSFEHAGVEMSREFQEYFEHRARATPAQAACQLRCQVNSENSFSAKMAVKRKVRCDRSMTNP